MRSELEEAARRKEGEKLWDWVARIGSVGIVRGEEGAVTEAELGGEGGNWNWGWRRLLLLLLFEKCFWTELILLCTVVVGMGYWRRWTCKRKEEEMEKKGEREKNEEDGLSDKSRCCGQNWEWGGWDRWVSESEKGVRIYTSQLPWIRSRLRCEHDGEENVFDDVEAVWMEDLGDNS